MAAAINIREEGIREIESRKNKADTCQEYSLVNFMAR